ncbi:MAG: 4Fe-4S binding protein [Anaerolineae bacterium]|nr:4Fe-4S binding protein [Anaerolineae bacterium]
MLNTYGSFSGKVLKVLDELATGKGFRVPAFDEGQCYGCQACYNHCPAHAIYTRGYLDVRHYAKPNAQLRGKLALQTQEDQKMASSPHATARD